MSKPTAELRWVQYAAGQAPMPSTGIHPWSQSPFVLVLEQKWLLSDGEELWRPVPIWSAESVK